MKFPGNCSVSIQLQHTWKFYIITFILQLRRCIQFLCLLGLKFGDNINIFWFTFGGHISFHALHQIFEVGVSDKLDVSFMFLQGSSAIFIVYLYRVSKRWLPPKPQYLLFSISTLYGMHNLALIFSIHVGNIKIFFFSKKMASSSKSPDVSEGMKVWICSFIYNIFWISTQRSYSYREDDREDHKIIQI